MQNQRMARTSRRAAGDARYGGGRGALCGTGRSGPIERSVQWVESIHRSVFSMRFFKKRSHNGIYFDKIKNIDTRGSKHALAW